MLFGQIWQDRQQVYAFGFGQGGDAFEIDGCAQIQALQVAFGLAQVTGIPQTMYDQFSLFAFDA